MVEYASSVSPADINLVLRRLDYAYFDVIPIEENYVLAGKLFRLLIKQAIQSIDSFDLHESNLLLRQILKLTKKKKLLPFPRTAGPDIQVLLLSSCILQICCITVSLIFQDSFVSRNVQTREATVCYCSKISSKFCRAKCASWLQQAVCWLYKTSIAVKLPPRGQKSCSWGRALLRRLHPQSRNTIVGFEIEIIHDGSR